MNVIMKKIYAIAAVIAMMLAAPVCSHARDGFFNLGVKAGLNFTEMSGLSDFGRDDFLKTYTGFNAGLVFNFNLPLGFEINPEVLYVQSGIRTNGFNMEVGDIVSVNTSSTFKSGSIRVPVNIQWGIDLFNFIKPYVVVSPYVGAVLFGQGSIIGVDFNSESVNSYLNRFQYGIGVGAGIYVWKFQLSFTWNWDLNPTFKERGGIQLDNDTRFNGGELSLAFLF